MTSSVWIILFIILIIYILLNFNLKKKQIYFNTLIILIFFSFNYFSMGSHDLRLLWKSIV